MYTGFNEYMENNTHTNGTYIFSLYDNQSDPTELIDREVKISSSILYISFLTHSL